MKDAMETINNHWDWLSRIFIVLVGGLILWWLKKLIELPPKVDKLENKVDKLENKVDNLKDNVDAMRDEQQEQGKGIRSIREALIAKGVMQPLVETSSPKKITERGQELLCNHSVKEWLKNCPLVQDFKNLRGEEELDIFLKCLDWVNKDGKRKIDEIMYESNVSKEQCSELLALAIRDEILHKIQNSKN